MAVEQTVTAEFSLNNRQAHDAYHRHDEQGQRPHRSLHDFSQHKGKAYGDSQTENADNDAASSRRVDRDLSGCRQGDEREHKQVSDRNRQANAMARALDAAIKKSPSPSVAMLFFREAGGLGADGAQMEKQLVKLDEEGEEAVSETGKIGPIHFVDVDFALFAGGGIAPDSFIPNRLVGGGGIWLVVPLELAAEKLVLAILRRIAGNCRRIVCYSNRPICDSQTMRPETRVTRRRRWRTRRIDMEEQICRSVRSVFRLLIGYAVDSDNSDFDFAQRTGDRAHCCRISKWGGSKA